MSIIPKLLYRINVIPIKIPPIDFETNVCLLYILNEKVRDIV